MKNSAIFRFLFTFLVIGLFSCEQNLVYDDVEAAAEEGQADIVVQESRFDKSEVTVETIPEVMGALLERTGSEVSKGHGGTDKVSYKKANILLDEILQVSEKEGGTNYTFSLEVPDSPMTLFHNLVVKKDPKGLVTGMHVVEYEMTEEAIERFLDSGEDFRYFNATYRRHSFNSFLAM